MPTYRENAARQTLPLIPLRGIVAFPGNNINIELERDLSKKACEAALSSEMVVFLVTQRDTRVDGQLRMQPDSVIWVCATKVIELGRAMCTPDSVVVYAKVAGRCFRGSYLDVYRRFGWRTDFATLQRMVTDPQAEKELAAIARRFNIEASVHIDDWKEVEKTTFPMAIPKQIKPL
ncbi:MAG: DUF4292 domain-containing protein [Bacteroidales bacterium]|nr:DUF4292 domain-containing protein [Bacteroidales bacterium]